MHALDPRRFAPLLLFLSYPAVSLFLGFLREFQLRFVPPGAPLHQSPRHSARIFSSLCTTFLPSIVLITTPVGGLQLFYCCRAQISLTTHSFTSSNPLCSLGKISHHFQSMSSSLNSATTNIGWYQHYKQHTAIFYLLCSNKILWAALLVFWYNTFVIQLESIYSNDNKMPNASNIYRYEHQKLFVML